MSGRQTKQIKWQTNLVEQMVSRGRYHVIKATLAVILLLLLLFETSELGICNVLGDVSTELERLWGKYFGKQLSRGDTWKCGKKY
jgi:hypothetical protein